MNVGDWDLPDFLRQRGLELDRDAGAGEYRAQYLGHRGQKAKGYEFYHVAVTHVAEKPLPPPGSSEVDPRGKV